MSDYFEPWDPTILESETKSDDEGEVNGDTEKSAAQRRKLFEVRERLQRALIIGDRFNCVERNDPRADPYEPVVSSTHRVLGNAQTEVLFAPNSATSLLLSRQFEGISRKDILVQEVEERLEILSSFYAIIHLQMQNEHIAAQRRANLQLEETKRKEAEWRSTLATRFMELESNCRRRTESAADECSALVNKELSRAFNLLNVGHHASQRGWLVQQEERSRHNLILDFDRGLSRVFGQQLSEAQGITVRTLLKEKNPMNNLALLDASPQTSTRHEPSASFLQTTGARTRGGLSDATASARAGGESGSDMGEEPVPSLPPPSGLADSETESMSAQDLPSSFTKYWGWMFRSTGVLMTWQRRFFIFTNRGKLKCSTSDKGPWSVVLSAHNILRVEVDSYHDTRGGAAPPTTQYHQYGFYVDAVDPNNSSKTRRMRFCCSSRQELRAWLTVLRRAADLVVMLEDSGSLARSPQRLHLDKLANHAAERGLTKADDPSQVSYRRRVQLEQEVATLDQHLEAVEQQRRRMKHRDDVDPALVHPFAHYNVPSESHGKPPVLEGSAEAISEECVERVREASRQRDHAMYMHQ